MEFDKDLQSIQEIRDLVANAKAAQAEYVEYSQEQMDKICLAVTKACEQNLEKLAKMANEETGYGVWQDKAACRRCHHGCHQRHPQILRRRTHLHG